MCLGCLTDSWIVHFVEKLLEQSHPHSLHAYRIIIKIRWMINSFQWHDHNQNKVDGYIDFSGMIDDNERFHFF